MFSLIGSSYDEYIDTKLIALISGGVNLSTSLVTAIYKKINMGGTVDSHLFAVNMYTKLSHNISAQLALTPEEREPMPKYLKDKLSEYENLILESPIIPEHIKYEGLKRIHKMEMNVSIPNEIAGGVDRVNVYRCEEKEKSNAPNILTQKVSNIRPIAENIKTHPQWGINKSADEVEKMFVMMKAEPEKDSKVEASIMIQKHFRGFLGRRYCKMLRQEEINKSATTIQKHFRGYSVRHP